jgi:hypothetical protein
MSRQNLLYFFSENSSLCPLTLEDSEKIKPIPVKEQDTREEQN